MEGIISDDLTPIELKIEQIYLDPNNPRFVDDNWMTIVDDSIDQENVQDRAMRDMIKSHDVAKLRLNMEENGFLPIDQVIVRQFKQGKYVVLEGNRRIAAAKQILDIKQRGGPIKPDVLSSAKTVRCLLYTGSDKQAAWTFQGLRHITGIRPWSAYNKAKLMHQLMEDEGKTLSAVGKRFGLTAFGAGQWIRGYRAFRQAKDESEYSREISESAYTYFQELFGRSNLPLREWMEWDDDEYRFKGSSAFDEFLGWLYPKPNENELDDDVDPDDIRGDWDNRRILTNRGLREVSYLIKNGNTEFETFRNGEDLTKAYATARLAEAREAEEAARQPAEDLLRSISDLARELDDIPTLRFKQNTEMRDTLFTNLSRLQQSIDAVGKEFR